MNQRNPWAYIRWSRRVFIGLPIVFILGMLITTVVFPNVPTEVAFEKFGISLVLLGWVFVLIPTSSPRCNRCFVLWNLPNWGYWFGLYLKNAFRPFVYISAVFNSPCPHCGLEYFADPGDSNAPQGL